MRILLVSEDVPFPSMGGLGKHALTLARALIRAGHQVDFMGTAENPIEVAGEEGQFGGRFFGELDGHVAGWKEVPLGVFMPMRRTWIARRFARIILRRAADYDVIHYHGHLPNVALFIPTDVNFIQTRHDQGSDCLTNIRFFQGKVCTLTDPAHCADCKTAHPNPLQRAVSTLAVRQYRDEVARAFRRHKTVFVSDLLQKNFSRTMGNEPWGVTLHNFVDTERLAKMRVPQTGDVAAKETLHFFIAGKLYPAKGVEALLAELTPRMPPHLHIQIAGDGFDEKRLRQLYGSAQIRFEGWCDQDRTLAMAARADAVIVPSIVEEACATTVLEALALGKTTFALARGGTPELRKFAAAPDQLQLFADMTSLVDGLLQFKPHADYPLQSESDGNIGGVDRAARELLQLYQRAPGPLHAGAERKDASKERRKDGLMDPRRPGLDDGLKEGQV